MIRYICWILIILTRKDPLLNWKTKLLIFLIVQTILPDDSENEKKQLLSENFFCISYNPRVKSNSHPLKMILRRKRIM